LYGLRLAEELDSSPDQLRALAQGGIVHDVGKITIPDAILNKPGKLTPEERLVIEQHPVNGYMVCKRLGFMAEELGIIRSHHEKWDGSGYPDRLKGKEIPFLARIIAVADVYDALTSARSYRGALSHEEALAWMLREKGNHFDPECLDGWLRVFDKDPYFYEEVKRNEWLPPSPKAAPFAG
jgi:HD-GYP domain-containing protein (c-di-GMP phosphodiesterase class II)